MTGPPPAPARALLLAVIVLRFAAAAAPAEEFPAAALATAAAAYSNDEFGVAADLYEQALRADVSDRAVILFNLGSAHMAAGRYDQAILAYRRAEREDPNDEAIAAALNRAASLAGVALPERHLLHHLFRRQSRGQWVAIAVALYWAACLLPALYILSRRRLHLLLTTGVAALLLLPIPLAGIGSWLATDRKHEAVVVRDEAQAYLAPTTNARPSFSLPIGAIVEIRETVGDWHRVTTAENNGWLPTADCAAIAETNDEPRT